MRITDHPVLGPAPHRPLVTFTWCGQTVAGHEGEPIGAALLAAGIRTLRHSCAGTPRGIYCGIGHCFECRVTVDGVPGLRACLTPVRAGSRVTAEGSHHREAADHAG